MTPSVEIDEKQLARAIKRIEQYGGRPLQQRAKRAYLEGARLMVRPLQRAAPVKTGAHRKSIKARANRLRAGEMAVSSVGPTSAMRHFPIRGVAAHSLEAKRAGKGGFSVLPSSGAGLGFAVRGIRFGARSGTGPSQRTGNVRSNAGLRHPGSKPNPYVDRVLGDNRARVVSFINQQVLDLGETFRAL